MTLTTPSARRPSTAARRFGYLVAVAVNAAFLFAVNAWPGWDVLPFLTEDTRNVIGIINAAAVVGLVANVVFLLRDAAWLKALGDIVTTAVGLVAVVRVWQVFPFDFGSGSFDWDVVANVVLGVAAFGSTVGIIVAMVSLLDSLVHQIDVHHGTPHPR